MNTFNIIQGGIPVKHIIKPFFLSLSAMALVAPSPMLAQGTTTYEYDALGRLIEMTTNGGANDGLGTVYEYDAAGNRKRVEVTGSDGTPGGPSRIIVLPINGFLVIPIKASGY